MATFKKIFTRHAFECPIFGSPRDFHLNRLPTFADVIRCCSHERLNMSIEANNKKIGFSKVASKVAHKIKAVFEKASIPTVSEYRIVQLINAYHKNYNSIRKSYNRDKNKEPFKRKLNAFKEKSSLIFDVSACKCPILVKCTCNKTPDLCDCKISVNCRCKKSSKIPIIELRFVYLQRKYRMGTIGGIDAKETKILTKKLKRKSRDLICGDISIPSSSKSIVHEPEIEDRKNENKSSDEDFEPSCQISKWQMRKNLKSTALVSDRYGVSDRATAAIASSVLQDVGLITNVDSSQIVDKNKIRREKRLIRTKLKNEPSDLHLRGLYFDGRKDETLVMEKTASKKFRRVLKEVHYSLLQEPNSIYIGHVTPPSGSSEDIVSIIISHLNNRGISIDKLALIGCDGTPVNTGWKNGVIRNIERSIGRPLQWAVCLLHFNELPLRHILQHLDGNTTGPRSLRGIIGNKLNDCEKLPVVDFKIIDCVIPDIDRKILSKDQQYLLDISTVINSGEGICEIADRDPGKMSHSRWLTTANRVLRLYLSERKPSKELQEMVSFILNSYMPQWFSIKTKNNFTDGPKHIFNAIKTTRYLSKSLLKIVDPVIERNAFFAHSENLMLAMAMDDKKNIRELGLRQILKARQSVSKANTIRNFRTPKLNFEATKYTDIISWDTCDLTPPPLLQDVSDDEINSYIHSGEIPEWDLKRFPCHTQAVERCVQLVSEASRKVCGAESRDGFVRTTMLSRSKMSEFSHKSDFQVP